jgi:hypothetical protein
MGQFLNTWHEVTAPPAIPYRFGVFSVVEPRTAQLEGVTVDEHWRLGVQWVSEACALAEVTFGNCIEPEVAGLISDRTCAEFQYDPFTVYAFNTDAIPGHTLSQHEANAIARLTNGEQRAVESVLWQKLLAADPVPTDLTMFPAWIGLGWIEQQLAEQYGSMGVIHMNRYAATALSLHLRIEGGVMRTLLGTPVIVGGGYDPTPNPIVDTAVVFGSGPVAMWRGDIDTRENAVDKALNDVSIVAQRDYVLGWDCVAVSAEISLGCPTADI